MKTVPSLAALCALLLFLFPACMCPCTCPFARTHVTRYAWITGLKPDQSAHYKDLHGHPWPGVNRMIKECHIRNFSIYAKTIKGHEYLFAYLEYTGKDFAKDMKKMAADPETQRWWKQTDPCQSPLPDAPPGKIWTDAVEVYHLD